MTLLRSLILAVVTGFTAVSCERDAHLVPGKETTATDEVLVRFRAGTSDIGHFATRAASDTDFAVNRIDLLVLTQPAGRTDFTYNYSATVRHLEQPNNTTVNFEALLKKNNGPVKILVVANSPEGLLDNLSPGLTETSVRNNLYTTGLDFPQGIPMTGVAQVASLPTTGIIDVPLMRSVAKTTVAVDLDGRSRSFRMSTVSLYRHSFYWQLFPDAANVIDETTAPQVIFPSICDNNNTSKLGVNVSATQFFSYYMPEKETSDATTLTRIIVGGYFDTDTTPSYYGIEFGKEGDDARPLGVVLRNHLYQFTITGATARGLPNESEANRNPGVGLVTTVAPWNGGNNTDYYFGDGDYIKLSNTNLIINEASIVQQVSLTITTTGVPFTITSNKAPGEQFDTSLGDQRQQFWVNSPEAASVILYSLSLLPSTNPDEMRWYLIATLSKKSDITSDILQIHAADGMLTIQIPLTINYTT